MKKEQPRIALVHPFCTHYTAKTFEILARQFDVDYYFFSDGGEWYWMEQHGIHYGDFRYEYLPGFRLGGTRITPTLPMRLWRGDYAAVIASINGRFALPISFLTARLKRKPFILWTGIWMRLQTPAQRMIFRLTYYIYRHADAIVVYGEHVKRYLIDEGVSPERIFVAAHAIDNSLYNRSVSDMELAELRDRMGIGPNDKVILFLGRLEEVKGLPYLLQAVTALRRSDVVLLLAGEGSQQAELQALAAQLGIQGQVRFIGYVPPAQTLLYYALAWVYVLPSITLPAGKELWGLVINEAFNQGLPVITTTSVGAAAGGLVRDEVNGLIVPERDSEALMKALRRILDDPELRQQMSEQARAAIAGWTQEVMVGGFRQAIAHVTGKSCEEETYLLSK